MKIAIEKIIISEDNPRQNFNEESLRRLGESMKTHGQLQDIIVRPKDSNYELVVGERRLRAAQLVGIIEINAKVEDIDDNTAMELRLIENTQREDLTGAEKGDAVYVLLEKYPEKYPTISSVARSINTPVRTVRRWCAISRKLSPKVKTLIIYNQTIGENKIGYLLKYTHNIQEKLAKAIIENKEELTKDQWRKFFKLYDENPTAKLDELVREAKGVKFVQIDTSKLTPKARKEIDDIIDQRKKEMEKKRKESLAKARKASRKHKPSKPRKKPSKPKPETNVEPPKPKPTPVPFRRIEETETVMITLIYPTKTFNKLSIFMGKKRMIIGEAVVYLTEKGLEAEGIE